MKLLRKLVKKAIRVVSIVFAILIVALLVYAAPWLWRNMYVYPKLEKTRSELYTQYKKPVDYIKQTDYKGVLHAHSYWSHDSRGVLEEILPAAKKAELDFIFLSDHAHAQLDTFPRGYQGTYNNVLIEPGTERSGLMVSPLKGGILDWDQPKDSLIKGVVESGGLVLYVHTEEKHPWDNPDYQAMEIYNIHTDLIDEEGGIAPHILNFAINGKSYRHWAMREIFDEQTSILARWDSINTFKKVVGMAAVDAHNNQNIRARYTDDGRVEWVGPNADEIKTVEPGWKEKLLLGEPDVAGWAFKFETDTYFHSFNYVNTHVFCDTLSAKNIKENLVKGHAFIAFESLADAKGFQFFATDREDTIKAIMGDSVSAGLITKFQAESPFPVQFKLIKDGEVVDVMDDAYSYEYKGRIEQGNYRLEAFLDFDGEQLPWIYTNPIYVNP